MALSVWPISARTVYWDWYLGSIEALLAHFRQDGVFGLVFELVNEGFVWAIMASRRFWIGQLRLCLAHFRQDGVFGLVFGLVN